MKWAGRHILLKNAFFGGASLFLLHGLIAGPLFVQCVLDDGHAILEMLGHNPHQSRLSKLPDRSSEYSGHTRSISRDCGAKDCMDLILNNSAVLGGGTNRLMLISDANADNSVQSMAEHSAQFLELVRNPVSESLRHSQFDPSLRI
jgi:hypothetical protein